MDLDFVFKSPDHIRYEHGNHVAGPHGSANRAVKVEPNINGGDGYTITVYNLDGNHPVWQNNVQVAPKQMKIMQQLPNKVVLRGYGYDRMGGAFDDYGLTVHFANGDVSKCILHLHDRNVDIEYLRGNTVAEPEPEIVALAKAANDHYQNQRLNDCKRLLVQVYRSVQGNPGQLKNVIDFAPLGRAFLLMLDQDLSDDIDVQQMMVSISYLCVSKAINADPNNLNLYRDRMFLLRIGHEPFKYTVMLALRIDTSPLSSLSSIAPLQARDAIYKMEIADLELHPKICNQEKLFGDRKIEFTEMVGNQFFLPERTMANVVDSGLANHKALTEYLSERVIDGEDIDF